MPVESTVLTSRSALCAAAQAHTLHSTDQEQPTAANCYRHAGAPSTVWTDSTDQDWRRAIGTRRAEVCGYIALIHLVLSFSTQLRLYAMPQR
jgi:hypothetical protein